MATIPEEIKHCNVCGEDYSDRFRDEFPSSGCKNCNKNREVSTKAEPNQVICEHSWTITEWLFGGNNLANSEQYFSPQYKQAREVMCLKCLTFRVLKRSL